MKVDGRCLCGYVKYQAQIDQERVAVCHCKDCQVHSASAYGVVAHIAGGFQLLSGELKTYVKEADSGTRRALTFCPECGNRIYNRTKALMSVKAGTLDDTSWFTPDAHYWTKRRQAWVNLPDDVACFEEAE